MYVVEQKIVCAIASLSLTIAVISSVLIVPFLGIFLDALFALPSVSVFILAIIGFIASRRVGMSTLPVVLSAITSGFGIFSMMLLMYGVFGNQANTMLDLGSQIFVNFIYLLVGLATWCGYIACAILNYRQFYLLRKQQSNVLSLNE